MEFSTRIPIAGQEPKIDYNSRIFLLGSCFVENIGKKLEKFKLPFLQNPFGIFFHPVAIAHFLEKLSGGGGYSHEEIFYHNERWHCFDAHSHLSHPDPEKLVRKLNTRLEESRQYIKDSTHLIITLGTAWGYTSKDTGRIVANCHKLPSREFRKSLLGPEQVRQSLEKSLNFLEKLVPEASIIFSISPVRHLRDGFIENQRSKASLISGLHELLDQAEVLQPRRMFYFPSYEILQDELRDYRFYTRDLVHPSGLAVDYVWKRFVETWFSPEAEGVLREVEAILKGLDHRPFHPDSQGYKKFRDQLEERIRYLQRSYPGLHF